MITTQDIKPLGQVLLDQGLASSEQIERALAEQRHSGNQKLLGEVLVELHICTEAQIAEALAQTYGVPFARLNQRLIDPAVLNVLPADFAVKHQVLPLYLVEDVLSVAVAEPSNVFLLEEVEQVSGHRVQVVSATASDIAMVLGLYRPNAAAAKPASNPNAASAYGASANGAAASAAPAISVAPADGAIQDLVQQMLTTALAEGASDIHLDAREAGLRLRMRVHGRLIEKQQPPGPSDAALIGRLKAMAGLNAANTARPQEGIAHVNLDGRALEIRISAMPARPLEKLTLHLGEMDRSAWSYEKLGFGYDTLKSWRKVTLGNGLLIVTGPTGSGKRTTLYAVLQQRNAPDMNLCTIEDPIQFNLQGVNQFQIDETAHFGYARALRSLRHQDLDILMIQTLTERKAAKLATRYAMQGKFVLAGMQATSCAAAIAHLLHLGIDPYHIGSSLSGVLAQRLVRKLCPTCKEPYDVGANEKRQLEKAHLSAQTLYRPRGCDACRDRGFNGRLGIHELLIPDEAMVDALSRGASLAEIRRLTAVTGLKSLRLDAMEKAVAGLTTLDEVARVVA